MHLGLRGGPRYTMSPHVSPPRPPPAIGTACLGLHDAPQGSGIGTGAIFGGADNGFLHRNVFRERKPCWVEEHLQGFKALGLGFSCGLAWRHRTTGTGAGGAGTGFWTLLPGCCSLKTQPGGALQGDSAESCLV
ncbi:hypothetical protein H1C71_028289 [Ictidomys tridecemlineatus]|nr:hypothetical protein H1C71_028289 [Ictidomys tridecemlineatus]